MARNAFKSLVDLIREPARKRKISIFLICLFCSAVFWLFVKLSRENQAVFQLPIGLTGLPDGKVLAGQNASSVYYTLQATGARLVLTRFSAPSDTLQLDYPTLQSVIRHGETVYYATSGMILSRLSLQADAMRTVISINPDTVFFQVVDGAGKTVPVVVHSDIEFENNFGLYGKIIISPDSVRLSGPANLLDSINYVSAEDLSFTGINQTIVTDVKIGRNGLPESVSVVPQTVGLTIPVEEYTEAYTEVILSVNCQEGSGKSNRDKLKLLPNRVRIYYLIALKDYGRVQKGLFSAFVNCPGVSGSEEQLEVFVDQSPAYIKLESIRPAKVDYLIMK